LEPGRGFDVLIGFLNEIEREFFERFISVSGVGPKAALRALTQSIPTIARAIDEANLAVLKSLPGIGEQRAKEIVAKLQGKVGKFALIQSTTPVDAAGEAAPSTPTHSAMEDEAVAILLQLEYSRPEAKEMVRLALVRNPKIKTAEEVLNEVYRQRSAESPAAPAGPVTRDGGAARAPSTRSPRPPTPTALEASVVSAEDPYAV
jgi:Holliday junction DNA helicase RuvA